MYFGALLLLLLQTLQGAPVQVAPAQVRGHVTASDNSAPVRQAEVILRSTRGPNLRRTVTDALGAYEFRDVEPGNYTLTVNKPGFVTWNYGQTDIQSSAVVRVGPGEKVEGIDFKVVRAGVISGTVTGDDGEPLRRVTIYALARNYRWGYGELTTRAAGTSDDRGQYRVFDLMPGRYYVYATPYGYSSPAGHGGLVPAYYRSGSNVESAEIVQVPSTGGEASHIDFVLRTAPSYSVSGTVVDGVTGKPVSAAGVFVTASSPIGGGGGGLIAESSIQRDGRFQMTGVPPGLSRLNGRVPAGSGVTYFNRWLEINASDLTGMVITLYPPVPVRGHVIVDGGELPPDLRVALIDRKNRTQVGSPPNAPTSKDGAFEIPNVQPGDYDIAVDRINTARQAFPADKFYVREVRSAGKDLREQGLVIPENFVTSDLEVVLDFHVGTVTGTVMDEQGAPLPGAIVVLVSPDAKKRASDRGYRFTMTNTSGKFTISGVIPEDYQILVWPSTEYYQLRDPEVYRAVEKHAIRLTVAKDSSISQDLRLLPVVRATARELR